MIANPADRHKAGFLIDPSRNFQNLGISPENLSLVEIDAMFRSVALAFGGIENEIQRRF